MTDVLISAAGAGLGPRTGPFPPVGTPPAMDPLKRNHPLAPTARRRTGIAWAFALALALDGGPSALCGAPRPVTGPGPQGPRALDLSSAVQKALALSPDVAALEAQVKAERSAQWQALAPSDPSASASFNDMPSFIDPGKPASSVWGLSQSFNFPGEAFVTFAQLGDQADALERQLHAERLQVSANVKTAYRQLQLARKNLALNDQQERLDREIVQVVKRRFQAASVTEVDLADAQMAVYSNEVSRADLELAEKQALANLNVLLGLPPAAPETVEPLPERIDLPPAELGGALKDLDARNDPIRQARAADRAAGKALGLAWMSLLANFTVQAGSTFYDAPVAEPDGIQQTYYAAVSANFPLWFFLNESSGIAQGVHNAEAADKQLAAQRRQQVLAVESAVDTLQDIRTKLEEYRDHLLPLSDVTVQAALTNYGTGKIQFQDLANAVGALWANKAAYYQLVESYALAYTAYAQLLGEDR